MLHHFFQSLADLFAPLRPEERPSHIIQENGLGQYKVSRLEFLADVGTEYIPYTTSDYVRDPWDELNKPPRLFSSYEEAEKFMERMKASSSWRVVA